MATVRRARLHILYLLAFIVSGVFSVFGKQAPLWAQEAERAHSAKIFNQEFFGAPPTEATGTLLAQSTGTVSTDRAYTIRDFTNSAVGDRAFTIKDRAFTVMPDNRSFTWNNPEMVTTDRFFTAPEQVNTVNQQLVEMLSAIQLKIQGGENLTAGEMALLVQLGGMN